MGEPQRLQIPWIPISLNEWAAQNKYVKSRNKRQFTAAMREYLQRQKAYMMPGRVDVGIRFVWCDLRARDVDNRAKWVLDALAGMVMTDDNWQVVRTLTLSGTCEKGGKGERTEITITPVEEG